MDGALSQTPPANAAGCRGRRYRLASAFPRRYLAAGVFSPFLLRPSLFPDPTHPLSLLLPRSLATTLCTSRASDSSDPPSPPFHPFLCPSHFIARSSAPYPPTHRGNRCWSGPELVQNRWTRATSASRGVSLPIYLPPVFLPSSPLTPRRRNVDRGTAEKRGWRA